MTNTPTQALLLANNDWPMTRARAFAKRLFSSRKQIGEVEIAQAYQIAWGRPANDTEIQLGLAFVNEQAVEFETIKPANPAPKFPNESGLCPIAQNFSKVSGVALGDRALWLQPGSRFERLHLRDPRPEGDTFTVEAIAQLDAIHRDAKVNTIVSRWNGNHSSPGWSLGVTSEKSRYKPRNLIVQLIGSNPGGDTEYEVVASNLRVPTGRPVLMRATISPGKVDFTLHDLADPEATIEVASINHNLTGGFQSPETKLLIGGRDHSSQTHLWDGQLARVSIGEGFSTTFTDNQLPENSTWLKKERPAPKRDPQLDAFADFCHALLSSNEFLYLH